MNRFVVVLEKGLESLESLEVGYVDSLEDAWDLASTLELDRECFEPGVFVIYELVEVARLS